MKSTAPRLVLLAVLAVAVATSSTAAASNQVGVYGLVSRVVFEPDAVNPTTVQVHGWFTLANINTGAYNAPVEGFFYYQCPKGQAATCTMEWKEMAKSVNSGNCVGFGARRDPNNGGQPNDNGRVRAFKETPANPDDYPLSMGVATVSDTMGALTAQMACGALKMNSAAAPDMAQAVRDMAAAPPARDMAQAAGAADMTGGTTGGAGDMAGKGSDTGGCSAAPGERTDNGPALALVLLFLGGCLIRRRGV